MRNVATYREAEIVKETYGANPLGPCVKPAGGVVLRPRCFLASAPSLGVERSPSDGLCVRGRRRRIDPHGGT